MAQEQPLAKSLQMQKEIIRPTKLMSNRRLPAEHYATMASQAQPENPSQINLNKGHCGPILNQRIQAKPIWKASSTSASQSSKEETQYQYSMHELLWGAFVGSVFGSLTKALFFKN